MKVTRKIIRIDEERCDGCGNCVPACAEGALEIVNGKARVVADIYCDGLGACIGECPTGALQIVEREADEFDEKAVAEFLAAQENRPADKNLPNSAGCPSAKLQTFIASEPSSATSTETGEKAMPSSLSHWPVQIMLVPPTAPFLKGADLLVLADCVPVAFPTLHRDFLQGKAVMMGCPKFDDAQHYIDKFAQIFKTAGLKSITAVVMEVPCCSALPMIIQKGMQLSGVNIPVEEVVISTRGKIIERRKKQAV